MSSCFHVGKLVRDHMPDLLTQDGVHIVYSVLSDPKDYLRHLKNKIIEEAQEVCEASSRQDALEEIADIQEVLLSLMQTLSISPADIEVQRQKKKALRGGFSKGLYCTSVSMSPENPHFSYYQAHPHKYPLRTEAVL